MKIRFDGKDYDLTVPAEAAAYQQAVADFQARHSTALEKEKARADSLESENKKLKAELADEKRLDAAVAERVELYATAARVLGTDYEVDGKSSRSIMVDVIRADDKDFEDKGSDGKPRSDEYVRARFDFVAKSGARFDSVSNVPKVVRSVKQRSEQRNEERIDANDPNAMPDVEGARLKMIAANRSAWETPAKA